MNSRVLTLNKSATLRITALTKKLIREGNDIVNFAAGEPDFDTPEFVKNAAKQAIDDGFTKYTPSSGIPDLKKAIAEKLNKENKIECVSDNIIVTAGAKYAIFAALFTLLNPDDEVIIPSPYWVSYPEMVKLTGAKPVFLPLREETNFKINPADLQKAITPKTKVLILNYPSNPAGTVYDRQELDEICSIIQDKNIFVISDEIYESLIYDGLEHVSFASLPNASNITLTVNGFSKAFSMTGWRIGYLAGPKDIIQNTSKIIDHTTSCACSISQKGALAALKNSNWVKDIQQKFQQRRDKLYAGLKALSRIHPIKPKGSFYMFCDIRKTGLSSQELASKLLESYQVSCIPAASFGAEGFIRISFSTSAGQIEKGIERINRFLKEL